jgi:hypothetical protein
VSSVAVLQWSGGSSGQSLQRVGSDLLVDVELTLLRLLGVQTVECIELLLYPFRVGVAA